MSYSVVMTQSLSVKCKLIVPKESRPKIEETLLGFAAACNQILDIATRENCWNTTKLHHLSYYSVKGETGLKANHVCQAIRRVIGNSKLTKKIHKFRPTSISLDIRTFKYVQESQTIGITLKSGRVQFDLSIGGYQIALLRGQTLTSATLNKTRQGDYYINFVVELDTPPTGKTPKVIGVDLGRRTIAVTNTGKDWSGEQIKAVRDKYSKVRSSIQSKCTKSAKRLLRRLSGKEARFQKNVNHTISKQLVAEAKELNASLVFEDLKGINKNLNKQPRSKTERRRSNSWAFFQLRTFITYKAAIIGVPVILVPPAYTSQTCHKCLHVHPIKGQSYRNGKSFKCGHCGYVGDADHNASNMISLLGAVVIQPESSTLFCSLNILS